MNLTLLEINNATPRSWRQRVVAGVFIIGVAYGAAYATEKGRTAGKEKTPAPTIQEEADELLRSAARRTRQRERRERRRAICAVEGCRSYKAAGNFCDDHNKPLIVGNIPMVCPACGLVILSAHPFTQTGDVYAHVKCEN